MHLTEKAAAVSGQVLKNSGDLNGRIGDTAINYVKENPGDAAVTAASLVGGGAAIGAGKYVAKKLAKEGFPALIKTADRAIQMRKAKGPEKDQLVSQFLKEDFIKANKGGGLSGKALDEAANKHVTVEAARRTMMKDLEEASKHVTN